MCQPAGLRPQRRREHRGHALLYNGYCDSRVLWDPLLPDVPREGREAIYRAKFEALALLHRVDYAALGLADFGRPGSYVARQISRWGKQYKASETEKIESMDRLFDWLPANLPTNDETVLVHGDYRLDNMIFHPAEPRVLGSSTGRSRPWAIRWPNSPIFACSGAHPRTGVGCWDMTSERRDFRARPKWWATTAPCRKRAVPEPAVWEFYGLQPVPRVLHPSGRLRPVARHGLQHASGRVREAGEARPISPGKS